MLTQSCPTLCNPMDCSPPGFSVHGILQARILEWVALPSSGGSSKPRDPTHVSSVSALAGGLFTTRATWEAQLQIMLGHKLLKVLQFQQTVAVLTKAGNRPLQKKQNVLK